MLKEADFNNKDRPSWQWAPGWMRFLLCCLCTFPSYWAGFHSFKSHPCRETTTPHKWPQAAPRQAKSCKIQTHVVLCRVQCYCFLLQANTSHPGGQPGWGSAGTILLSLMPHQSVRPPSLLASWRFSLPCPLQSKNFCSLNCSQHLFLCRESSLWCRQQLSSLSSCRF